MAMERRGGETRAGKTGRSGRARRRQPAEVRREQIADAALRIIAEQGLRQFTGRAIARELGMTDAAVFRHLPTKQAIVGAALDRVERLLFENFPPADDDPIGRLGRFFRRRAEIVAGHAGIARLMFSEDLALAGGPDEAGRVLAFKRRSSAFVRACLEEAYRRRMLAAGLGSDDAVTIVVGTLMAFVFSGGGPGKSAAVARKAGRLWGTLESLLRRGAI